MWFHQNDIQIHKPIKISGLRGYVLPHAGTEYTGEIISHTLRFRPSTKINKIYIIYYPATDRPDIEEMYHEYYVPLMCLKQFFDVEYIGINIRNGEPKIRIKKNELIVVSADFSHFLSFQKAISLENKAAHSLMFRKLGDTDYNSIIDDKKSFRYLYEKISKNISLQWVGRSRSSGLKGVGYLSFLLRENPKPRLNMPSGYFVTVYDEDMNSRECLGEWFTLKNKWNKKRENLFVRNVIQKAKETSRLTGGSNLDIPLSGYTITYLYKDRNKEFIRGYHGIKKDAFYLSDVFLEHTFEDGRWINPSDKKWLVNSYKFNLAETFQKLNIKSRKKTFSKRNMYQLYKERVVHVSIS